MRDQTTRQILDILAAQGITTAILMRLDFASETAFIWTGVDRIQVQGTGDSLLDGNTFESIANGVAVSLGDNSFTYSGSDALTVSIGIPASQTVSMAASQVTSDEYRGRSATMWRALMVKPSDPLGQPAWAFRRVRAGAMDKLEVTNDGINHQFSITIESHASLISNATQSSYLDQKTRYDSTDTSQDYAASISNPAPASASTITSSSAGGSTISVQGKMQNSLNSDY